MRLEAAIAVVALAGCGREAPPPGARQVGAGAVEVASRPVGDIDAQGLVVPRYTAELAAPAAGRVQAAPVPLGGAVAAGDVVVQLDPGEARHALRAAEAAAASATSRLAEVQETARFLTDRAEGTERVAAFVSGDELRIDQHEMRRAAAAEGTTRGELDVRRAEVARLRDGLDALTLRAPFAGEVAARFRGPGDAVAADEPVVRLISDERLVRFAVDAAQADAFPVGAAVRLVRDGAEVEARVVARAPEIDEAGMLLAEAAPVAALPWPAGAPCRVRPHPE